ncbi:MAG: ribosomal subunit interface protein [Omnitrophica bacterium GWA2_52_8]|nr:MAG: ribosomal subunit interface protein [Omnitrophica bacterium GWA2_52_8]
MDIRFSGKNIGITEGMRQHLKEKLLKLDKYAPRIVESHVVVKKEKYVYIAEVTLLAKHLRAYGEGRSKENIFTAMDQAAVKIEKQLKKFREKVKDHHKYGMPASSSGKQMKKAGIPFGLSPSEKTFPRIVKAQSFAAKPMSPEEASLQLRLLPEPFLVFRNASTQHVNVIFKRKDGDHGLVEPEF